MVFFLPRTNRRPYGYIQSGEQTTTLRARLGHVCLSLPISRPAFLILATFTLSLTTVVLTFRNYSSWDTPLPLYVVSGPHGTVYDPFVRPSAADAIANTTVRPIQAHSRIPDVCLEEWIAYGRWRNWCVRVPLEESHIDLVSIWVNGSDHYHSQSRDDLLAALDYQNQTKSARFRQHDELRYSLRSAFKNTKSWAQSVWHVITADVPDPAAESTAQRLGLVPQWMDLETSWTGGLNGEPPVYLYHGIQIFRMTTEPGRTPSLDEVDEWRSKVLPTFNSMAVESQLPHMDPDITSENIVYLNDDQFLVLPLPPSAFHTPLYGPVFRFVPGFMIDGDPHAGKVDGGGEWRSLGFTTLILDQRFGVRQRAYVEHNARALSLPLMHEAALAFGKNFADTARSQFRGSHTTPGEYEVNTVYAATHYVVERHREALLWSWVVGKWGGEEGVLDARLKDFMWSELGGNEEDELNRNASVRTTNGDVRLNMRATGLQQPQSEHPEKRANTTYIFVSMDGFASNYASRPAEFAMQRSDCIGQIEERAWDVFRRLAAEKTHCGDAVIQALTDRSPRGLDIFLPPRTSMAPVSLPAILPLVIPHDPPPLPTNPRIFAVRLIHRYSYAIGTLSTQFFGVESAEQARLYFSWLPRDLALLCVNDDLADDVENITQGDAALSEFFEGRWPVPLDYERKLEEEK
ncbi:hypothetical protein MIND_00102600 [Mycena indigotica]|uniref:Stealth protein CR3 conserved region 3 domain-containing protein n=1 Tax=Mycena indigotica TaxID=2126181 RepID=A0A8H6TEF2_9AGAR|nr:uncharacterized protein MIND_00102600 [Mycena indigotica]KAF7315861.1 hypothetical protein MIND_00102600 [Mycena indigotica]